MPSKSEEREYDGILLIEADDDPRFTNEEAEEFATLQKQFMESYLANKNVMSVEEWLPMEMQRNLPNCSADEITEMSGEIITTLKVQEQKQKELAEAVNSGRGKESWLANEAKRATSAMSAIEASKYLQCLDEAVDKANVFLHGTITTKAGTISKNSNLDGYIAEQYHAQTFNLNAEATGSPYRAKVLEPNGHGYAKNSVDIEIVDTRITEPGKRNVVRRYQSKYCKDAESTAKAFEQGDYRGQRKLVPDGQADEINKKVVTTIQAPDGTTSNPLTKERAKELQKQAQSGKWNDLNWNEYKARDLAMGVGKQAGQAALLGVAIGATTNVVKKVWDGEKIDGGEVVEDALKTGADFGIKAAAAGALKVGVEKGIIHVIPKGTPASTIANIVHVGIENIKIAGKIASGDLTLKEGMVCMEQTTIATVGGLLAMAKGTAIGAQVGAVLGPVGAAVGGFVGGTVGYMAGSAVGQAAVRGVQLVRDKVHETVKKAASAIVRGTERGVSRLFSWALG